MIQQKVLVIDDMENTAEIVTQHIKDYKTDYIKFNVRYIVDSTSDVLIKEMFDIYFIDIDMPKRNGFDTVKAIKEVNQYAVIIFVTNHDELVYKSFEQSPFYFIRKEHFATEFDSAMTCLVDYISESHKFLEFKIRGNVHIVMYDDIIYLENLRNDYKIVTENETYITRGSFRELGQIKRDERFARSHVSFLVNFRYVKYKNANELYYKDNIIPISRMYKKACRDNYFNSLRGLRK